MVVEINTLSIRSIWQFSGLDGDSTHVPSSYRGNSKYCDVKNEGILEGKGGKPLSPEQEQIIINMLRDLAVGAPLQRDRVQGRRVGRRHHQDQEAPRRLNR